MTDDVTTDCITAVARKISQSFCQKCRWQVTDKHACMHLTYVALHEVTWSTVVWSTQNAPRRQQLHVAPAMPALLVHHFGGHLKLKNKAIKKLFTHTESHASAVTLLESGE